MKKLSAVLALFMGLTVSVAAEDVSTPTSAQLDHAIEQAKRMGIDTSKLPQKDQLMKMLSGENGRRLRDMAKKLQEQKPAQFQQMKDRMQQHFDKNGDGHLGPHERDAANKARQQSQAISISGQDAIRVKRRTDAAPANRNRSAGQAANRRDGNQLQATNLRARPATMTSNHSPGSSGQQASPNSRLQQSLAGSPSTSSHSAQTQRPASSSRASRSTASRGVTNRGNSNRSAASRRGPSARGGR